MAADSRTRQATSGIPRLLHQTWRTDALEPRQRQFQSGWREHHPGWEYRLWTDADLRAFVAAEAPELLAMFDGYAQQIARVDMARYVILQRLGGLFVDLDMQCLRPVDPLLCGRALVIGTEPASHDGLAHASARGLSRLVCPSFMASVPGHPFWDDVRAALPAASRIVHVLDATGPFFLTRVHRDYAGTEPVTLVEPELLYPVDKQTCWSGGLFDVEVWERLTRPAYALHHWDGNWFRDPRLIGQEVPRFVETHRTDWPLGTPEGPVGPARTLDLARIVSPAPLPLVSCLMVTRGRPALAALAIDCYRRQLWRRRELVIVDDDPDDTLARHVAGLRDPSIRHLRRPDQGRPLGALRNDAVAAARGDFVCQWDDDDLYDPVRIVMQMLVMAGTDARACFLRRWLQWTPASGRLAVSTRRVWEGSLLCEKAALPPYPELPRGEDTPAVMALCARVPVVHLDVPRLYVYVDHGGNTHAGAHHAHLHAEATASYEGERAAAVIAELSRRLPLKAYHRARARMGSTAGARPPRPLDLVRAEAREASGRRRWTTAQYLWEEALALAPADEEALLGHAEALAARQHFPEAYRAFLRFSKAYPRHSGGPLGLLRLESNMGEGKAALRRCEALLARRPDLLSAHYEKARILLHLDRPDEAERVFASIEAVAPGHAATAAGMASTASYRQDWPLALERWRVVWQRFAHPSAPIEIVSALVHLERLEEAEAFVAGLAGDRRLALLRLGVAVRLCRLIHDWPRLLRLLEDAPRLVAGAPDMARLEIEALGVAGRTADALGRLDSRRLGRTSVDQATIVATLVRAGKRERLSAYLLDIASGPDLLNTSVQILPELLDCVREHSGATGVHAVLDRIDNHRALRTLKLASVFERDLARAREALADPATPGAGPAADRTERLLAALAAPAAHTNRSNDRFVRRAIDLVAAIGRRYPGARLDVATDPANAFAVADRIAAAIRARRPFCVVRLGDGEGNFLPYAAEHARHRRADQLSIQRIWWPAPLRDAAQLGELERLLAAAVRAADVIGVPDLYRLVRNFADGIPPNQTSRGALAVAEQLAGAVAPPEGGGLARPSALVTSCHLNAALAFWRLWEPLLAAAGECSLVCGRPELAAALADRFGLRILRVHEVPPERKFAVARAHRAPHHVERFAAVRSALRATAPGEVVLVAAGILGKTYCADVKAAGGIAIDVGSLADSWCGMETRNLHDSAATRAPAGLDRLYAARPDLDVAYPALRPAAFFAAAASSTCTRGG
ncbi:MAG: glycosyltransferase [Alphaproteobacteria bacterium]|nr:glycosyltransferase [Alphaproteobacteria bacterium]